MQKVTATITANDCSVTFSFDSKDKHSAQQLQKKLSETLCSVFNPNSNLAPIKNTEGEDVGVLHSINYGGAEPAKLADFEKYVQQLGPTGCIIWSGREQEKSV